MAARLEQNGLRDSRGGFTFAPAAPVDDAARCLEEIRHPADFVEDDDVIPEVVEKEHALGEPASDDDRMKTYPLNHKHKLIQWV